MGWRKVTDIDPDVDLDLDPDRVIRGTSTSKSRSTWLKLPSQRLLDGASDFHDAVLDRGRKSLQEPIPPSMVIRELALAKGEQPYIDMAI